MKKIMLFVAGFLLGCAVIIAYDTLTPSPEQGKEFICSSYDLPANTMEKTEVLSMIRNYYTKQYAALHDEGSPSKLDNLDPACPWDTRAVFFGLENLKKLIYFTEKAARDFTPQQQQNLGLNIYFASYPVEFNKRVDPWDYTNKHTLVFIPAMYDGTVLKDLNLRPNLMNGATTPDFINEGFFNQDSVTTIIALGVGKDNPNISESMNSQNNGTGTPPPPNPTNVILSLTSHN